jgi:hypothetical protein
MAASRDPFGAAKMKNRAKLISTLRVSGFADGNVRRPAALNRNKYNAIT